MTVRGLFLRDGILANRVEAFRNLTELQAIRAE